jgi:Mu transposase, C-terminal
VEGGAAAHNHMRRRHDAATGTEVSMSQRTSRSSPGWQAQEECPSRRVHQDGIHFQGFRYIDLTLAAYVGEDVTIRYDERITIRGASRMLGADNGARCPLRALKRAVQATIAISVGPSSADRPRILMRS